MAELLFTTDAFRPEGRPAPGVPMLLDGSMRLVEPVCAWLMHIALVRGRTRSPQTWRAYGEALYDWWQTLEADGWAWDRVSYHQVAAYRDRMLTGPSNHTGRHYARTTINFRLRVVALYYRWCVAHGLVEAAPFTTQAVSVARWRPAPFLAHVDASGGVRTANELVLREAATLPRPLAPDVVRRIVASLGARDHLMVEWAAMTGMRRMEIAGLGKAALPRTEQVEFASRPMVPVRLDITKGGKPREVYPPLPLVDRTHAYAREERAAAVRRAGRRTAGYREPAALFLTAHGAAMTPRRVGAMFAAACCSAGVEASFHALRHTFAGAMLRHLQRQAAERKPEMNPLLTLQTILGTPTSRLRPSTCAWSRLTWRQSRTRWTASSKRWAEGAAMRRPRKDYKLPPRPARLSEVVRPQDLVVNFLGPTGALVQTLEFSDHMGRPRLVAELALAVRHHLADRSRDTRLNARNHLHRFFEFLDQHDPGHKKVRSARDVGSETLRSYLAWLGRRPITKASRANIWTSLKMSLAWLQRHRPDLVQPGLELPFNAFPHRGTGTRPRPALAREEIEAILEACRLEIEASWADFQRGRELLAAADATMAAVGGEPMPRDLDDLGVLLAVLAQCYGGLLPDDGELLAEDTLSRRLRQAVTDHGGADRVLRHLHTTPVSLFPYMVAIAAQSYANPESLRNTRRDCMTEDPLFERRVHMRWHKPRAGRVQRRSFLRDRSLSVPNLVDRVLALSAPLVPHAAPEHRDKLFLTVSRRGSSRGPCRVTLAPFRADFVHRFVARHCLLDRHGKPLRFILASLRPTGLTHAHAALGHDVVKTQALGNHADLGTTRRYVDQPLVRAEQTRNIARLQAASSRPCAAAGGSQGGAARRTSRRRRWRSTPAMPPRRAATAATRCPASRPASARASSARPGSDVKSRRIVTP